MVREADSISAETANQCPISSAVERPPYKWDVVGATPTLGTIALLDLYGEGAGCNPVI
jgi:hypothetical protein